MKFIIQFDQNNCQCPIIPELTFTEKTFVFGVLRESVFFLEGGGVMHGRRTYAASRGFRSPDLGDVLKRWQGFGAYCRVNFKRRLRSVAFDYKRGALWSQFFFFCWGGGYCVVSVRVFFILCWKQYNFQWMFYLCCFKPSVFAVVHYLSISRILHQGVSPVPCSLSAREKCIRWYHCVWLWGPVLVTWERSFL